MFDPGAEDGRNLNGKSENFKIGDWHDLPSTRDPEIPPMTSHCLST